MKTVQELYDDMRAHDDVTAAMIVQDAITSLLKRAAVYRSTLLGDNVIELIVGELRNAIGEGGAATQFAVANMLATADARIGALNPIESATQLLQGMKTGQQAEIAPERTVGFNPPFGLVIQNRGISGVLISSYLTDAFTISSGGPLSQIVSATRTFPAGVLLYQGMDEAMPKGAFYGCDEKSYEATLEKATVIRFEEDSRLALQLLSQALEALDSGDPKFLIASPEACSPCPNFMQEQEWPKIADLIRAWIAEHS